jgi:hypothetical protein
MIYGRDGMGIIGMITAPFLLSFSFVEGRTRCSWLALYTCSLETTFGWALSLVFLGLGFLLARDMGFDRCNEARNVF